jgi:hypothetical protein
MQISILSAKTQGGKEKKNGEAMLSSTVPQVAQDSLEHILSSTNLDTVRILTKMLN